MAHTLRTYYVPGTSDSSPHLLFMDSSKLSELGPFSQSRLSVYTPSGRDLFCLEQGAHTISVMRCIQSGRHKVSRVGAHSGTPGRTELALKKRQPSKTQQRQRLRGWKGLWLTEVTLAVELRDAVG